jgi:hypothetical protein
MLAYRLQQTFNTSSCFRNSVEVLRVRHVPSLGHNVRLFDL